MSEILGLEEGLANCVTVSGKLKDFETKVTSLAGDLLAAKMKEFAPRWTGQLQESITVDRIAPNTVEVGPNVPYAIYMEDGSPPHRPPEGALDAWAADKGIPVEAVMSKIEEEGVTAHPFVKPAVEAVKPQIVAEIHGLSATITV